MIKCTSCGKEIEVVFTNGEHHVITKYYQGTGSSRIYYCDAKCSLDAYEAARTLLKLLGSDDVQN